MSHKPNSVHQGLIEVHAQLSSFILQIPDGVYAESLILLNGNSIGKHCRHILEGLECLESGLNNGQVEYEKRKRQILYEVDPHAFLDRLTQLIQQLFRYEASHKLKVQIEPFPGKTPAQMFESSLGRELLYNMEHIIHHMALIRIAANALELEAFLSPEFGVAFSTLQHQSK